MTKINLLYGGGDFVSGHLNIDPLADPENDKLIVGNWKNLDQWADDAEVTEILALHGLIEYVPRPEINDIVDHWIRKLRHGGKFIVQFTDCYEVAREFVNFNITMKEVNEVFHGSQDRYELVKKCSFTTHGFAEYLAVKHGMKIEKKRLNGFEAVVEAIRP